ncbi:growth/differentiation factor 8 [Elysia marginata]|uniref:Growth/differentiation factor 8 n=1 Tax=Elysia marginata TaxID=1093978 RepID=A0AAV4J4M2_9GAST|nr:growth/differentiation factor 8 [Elysia marginata]
MAKIVMYGALLNLVLLYFILAFQETRAFGKKNSPTSQLPQENNPSFYGQPLSNLRYSEVDHTNNKYQNYRTLKVESTQHTATHRFRRGVLSWFASYFQSDSRATQTPPSEQATELTDQHSQGYFDQDKQITTPFKVARGEPGKASISPQRQPETSSSVASNVKTSKLQSTTRGPRSTESSTVTDFLKKVNPKTWLTTVSAFLHNGVDVDGLQVGKSDPSKVVQPESSTAEYRFPLHGPVTEKKSHKIGRPHRIRHHKRHHHKVRGEPPVQVTQGSADETSLWISSGKDIRSDPKSIAEQGDHKGKKILPDGRQLNVRSEQCAHCRSNLGIRAKAGSKSMSEEEVKVIRKNMVAELMMQKLRLDPRDLISLKNNKSLEKMKLPMLPRAVLDETRERNSLLQEEDDFFARDQEAIVAGEDMGRDCVSMRSTGCYNFSFNGEVKGKVESAELWLYKTHDRRDITEQTFIVYELERPRGSIILRRRNLIAREGTSIKEGWVKLNVTRPVRRWLEKRREGEMLAIRCKTCGTHNYRAIFGTKHGFKPLLIIKYVDKYTARVRRSEDTCNPATECCKRPLTVNFNEINIPTILQPANLAIGYCYGYCDGIDSFSYNHTSIRQRLRFTLGESEAREQLKPCCVPLQLMDTFILAVENNIIVRKVLPKVIVDRCGCV